jgi:hypothetical protein
VSAVNHRPHIPRINEQGLPLSITEITVTISLFGFRQKPQTHRNLRGIEQLAGQGDHAIN